MNVGSNASGNVDAVGRNTSGNGDAVMSYSAIWVGGISHLTQEKDLIETFQGFARRGRLLSVHIRRQPRYTQGADDLGFVNFYNEDDAMDAYTTLMKGTGCLINGKRIKLRPPRRKVANISLLAEFEQMTSMILRDRRRNPNIPITTKSLSPSYFKYPGFPNDNVSHMLSSLSVSGNARNAYGYGNSRGRGRWARGRAGPARGVVLDLNRPWIGKPDNIFPFYVESLRNPSAPMSTLLEAKDQPPQVLMGILQRGMTNKSPYISFVGCPAWVPSAVLPHAIQVIRNNKRSGSLLVVVGRPRKNDFSLDVGVLEAIEKSKDFLAEPATPLVPANRVHSPPHRPISYLLIFNPVEDVKDS
ncbi:hypothetical protein AAMO2058_001535400 [Amorphochlora amoebiformis]